MDNPKVSIIVPIYRVEEYIERCAESLFAQTFDDIEYIFVDDCSPDKSVEILQRTLEKYPHRKRLTRIERLSAGRGAPRGAGRKTPKKNRSAGGGHSCVIFRRGSFRLRLFSGGSFGFPDDVIGHFGKITHSGKCQRQGC